MKAASCFSGIGAPELAGPEFDWLWHAEIEKFPSAVMAARHPGSVNLGDVTADDFLQRASAFGPLDLLAGGPPCQAFSVAGLRKSMDDERGNLSLRFVRIAHAVRPRNLLVENVPGWLNTKDNAFGCFLGAILGHDDALHSPLDGKWPRCGMASGPLGRLCWATLDAQFFGVAQRRRRVFVVVDFGNGADPAAVLFEPESLLRHSPPRREKGQGTAGTISARSKGGGGLGTDFEIDGGLTPICAEVAPTLNAHFGNKQGLEDQHINGGGACSLPPVSMCLNHGAQQRLNPTFETLIPVNRCGFDDAAPTAFSIMPMNSGKDYKAREVDIAQPIMAAGPVGGNQGGDFIVNRCGFDDDLAHTLKAEGFDASEDGTGRGTPLVPVAFSSKDYGNDASTDLATNLRSMGHAESHANGGGQMAVAFALRGRNGGAQPEFTGDHVNALRAASGGSSRDYVSSGWQVRRLTPIECERLQGFPDDFTNIAYRGKPAADGPRYKALGNSWAVPVGRWIIKRIAEGLTA